jgi:hypothetical protein
LVLFNIITADRLKNNSGAGFWFCSKISVFVCDESFKQSRRVNLTAQKKEEIEASLSSRRVFSEKQTRVILN